jgi:sphingolipid delta-4 desaturase
MLDWRFLATAYVIGATCNQNLFLAIHEISHNLAFRSPMANRLLAIFANFPIGVPYSAAFRVRPPPRRDTSRLHSNKSEELTQSSNSLTT